MIGRAEGEKFYLSLADGGYLPTEAAVGPWSRVALSGGPVCGALAHAVESAYGDASFIPARFAVELLRPVGAATFVIETRLVRQGRQLQVIEAALLQDGDVRARASCQMLRTGEHPAGSRWSPVDWQVPSPESLPQLDRVPRDTRMIEGEFRGDTQRRAWLRERLTLLPDQPLTPFQRVALMADFASPFSSSGTEGLSFINSDVSLAMHRLPEGEWIGMEVTDHQGSLGIALGSCRIYDCSGSFGFITTVGLSRFPSLSMKAARQENSGG